MEHGGIVHALIAGMETFEIIDCHEHLPREAKRLEQPVDVFTLFSQYTHGDLLRAGMSEEHYHALFAQQRSLAERWELLNPYWQQIRWGSYARALLLSLEKFYGFADITGDNLALISTAMQQANTPGIYSVSCATPAIFAPLSPSSNQPMSARQRCDPGHAGTLRYLGR